MKQLFLPLFALFSLSAQATSQPVIADLDLLERVGAVVLAREEAITLGVGLVDEKQREQMGRIMHGDGKCGGFELMAETSRDLVSLARRELRSLRLKSATEATWLRQAQLRPNFEIDPVKDPELTAAIEELNAQNIRDTVTFLSNFPTRNSRAANTNTPIEAMANRLRSVLAGATIPWNLEIFSHRRTPQKSIRVSFTGKTRPSEIVVLGGHVDSVSYGGVAPGADDNGSGSAAVAEAMRVFSRKAQPARTVEFFWYAAEEDGLVGSAEIASQYKQASKDVVGALQLDMTMFPGSGKMVVTNISDYTSAWLGNRLKALNQAYVKAEIRDEPCGYACSDHASWYRQGYPSVFPFEAMNADYNRNLHTPQDVIDSRSDFSHALIFSKFALLFALDMGNSELRQPY